VKSTWNEYQLAKSYTGDRAMQNKIETLKTSLRDLESKQDHLLKKIEKKIDKRNSRRSAASLKASKSKAQHRAPIEDYS